MSLEAPTIEEREMSTKIENLEYPIRDILEKMLPNIERGEYDLIIGIDASGRIPTIIMEKFIKHVYSKNRISLPDIRFMAGKINEYNAKEMIEKWNPSKKSVNC